MKKSIVISLAVLICIGGIYTIYTINNSSKNTSSKIDQTNNIKAENSIDNLHTTDSTNGIQQPNNEKQVPNNQQSNSETQVPNNQQSNSETQVPNNQQSNSETHVPNNQQSNSETQVPNNQQSNSETHVPNNQQLNNEKQQNNSNLNNILGIYYSSKIIGENKFYGDNTLVLTNNLYAFNGTNVFNPIYYIREVPINNLTTSSVVGENFGQNTQFKIIIPVPSNASSKTIDNYISFGLSHPSNFPCIGNNELIVFNSYKGAVVLKK